jgi:hypothetical protein
MLTESTGDHNQMIELDETAVLRQAKADAAEDGFTWELDFGARAQGAPLRGERFLSEDRRQEYLSRARDKLRDTHGRSLKD